MWWKRTDFKEIIRRRRIRRSRRTVAGTGVFIKHNYNLRPSNRIVGRNRLRGEPFDTIECQCWHSWLVNYPTLSYPIDSEWVSLPPAFGPPVELKWSSNTIWGVWQFGRRALSGRGKLICTKMNHRGDCLVLTHSSGNGYNQNKCSHARANSIRSGPNEEIPNS